MIGVAVKQSLYGEDKLAAIISQWAECVGGRPGMGAVTAGSSRKYTESA